jgi:hypothetical protein
VTTGASTSSLSEALADVINRDLDEAIALFDELAQIAGDDRRTTGTMRVVTRLAISVKTHALAEQKVLHEALRTADHRLATFALESLYEHQSLDVMVDKLLALRPGPELKAVVAVARRLFELRREREHRDLLAVVVQMLPPDEHHQLGRDLAAANRRLRPQVERMIGSPSRVG